MAGDVVASPARPTWLASSGSAGGHRGISCFVVEADWSVQVTKLEEKMGVRGSPTGEVVFDGVRVPADLPEEKLYFAATIDNITVARPQSGISKASLVYEAPVEAGITRFLAIYPEGEDVERIGPVRSARPYFLDWAAEFDALFVHVGGSPEALEKLRAYDMRDLNEFFNGAYFWRDRSRSAPHNTYTSTEKLIAADRKRFADRKPPEVAGWRFKDDAPAEVGVVTQLAVLLSPVGWFHYEILAIPAWIAALAHPGPLRRGRWWIPTLIVAAVFLSGILTFGHIYPEALRPVRRFNYVWGAVLLVVALAVRRFTPTRIPETIA